MQETALGTLGWEKKAGEEAVQVLEHRLRCSPWRAHSGGGVSLQPVEGPMLEQGRSVRRKELQSGAAMERPQIPLPVPRRHLGQGRGGRGAGGGVKLSLTGKKVGRKVLF